MYASSDVNIVLAVKMSYIEIQPTISDLSPKNYSHRRSEGCGLESRLGSQKFF